MIANSIRRVLFVAIWLGVAAVAIAAIFAYRKPALFEFPVAPKWITGPSVEEVILRNGEKIEDSIDYGE